MTTPEMTPIYEFGPFRLHPAERLLARDGQPIALKPKAFDLLVLLVERQGRLIPKEELLDTLWPGTFVEEANLTYTVSILRRALGDGRDRGEFIQTVPTKGYRFVAPVRQPHRAPLPEPDAAHSVGSAPRRSVRLALMGGTLALVAVAGTLVSQRVQRPQTGPSTASGYTLARLTADGGFTGYPSVSADGGMMAFASDRGGVGNLDIWLQHLDGTEAVRLTMHPADDYEPSFSSDGTRIAFRSNRDGGGVYVLSVLGGEPRLIARDGRRPRFSPDGKWLTYWTGIEHLFGETYVVAADGGPPMKIRLADPREQTRAPVWAPDGRRLLVASWSDWWLVPVPSTEDGPVATGALELIRESPLRSAPELATGIVPEDWSNEPGAGVVFSAVSGDSRNLWQIDMDPETGRAAGPPRRLTFGTGEEQQASRAADGRLVFAGLTRVSNIWVLPMDASSARASGEPHPVTHEARQLVRPDVSRDGRLIVFQDEKAHSGLSLLDPQTGRYTSAALPNTDQNLPTLTPDGSYILYLIPPGRIETRPVSGGAPRKLCEDCGPPGYFSFSSTREQLAYTTFEALMELDLRTGERRRVTLRRQPGAGGALGLGIHNIRYSPDGHWLAFHATDNVRREMFLVDLQNTGTEDAEWMPAAAESSGTDGQVAWSPDGNVLYFVSERDGFRCFWAQRLEPVSKRPQGPPVPVHHLHQTARRISHNPGRAGPGVGHDKAVVALEEIRGNIWMLSPATPETSLRGRGEVR